MKYKSLAFLLGLTCFIVQMVLIREFLNLFMGNELVIGITLALWMLLTASGALLGKKLVLKGNVTIPIFSLMIFSGIFPLAGAFLSIWIKTLMYSPGEMVNLQGVLLIGLAGMGAFCLVSGILFTLLASALSGAEKRNSISRIYAMEALGSLAGGIIFNFILIYTFNSLRILSIVLALNILVAAWYALHQRKTILSALSLVLFLPPIFLSLTNDLDTMAARMIYPRQEILMNTDTPFGKLVVTKKKGQVDIYSSGQVIGSNSDIMAKEEKVHFAMCLHPSPQSVLMLSGGIDGSADEVLKYNVKQFDYVDADPWLLEATLSFGLNMTEDKLNIHEKDPVRFVQGCTKKYDVVILGVPPPNTIGSNRFYTESFFQQIHTLLNSNGIISLALPSAGNYLDDETCMLYSSIFCTLESCFKSVRIIPAEQTYFLASDSQLMGNITELIHKKGIGTDYVNMYYLDDHLIEARAQLILDELELNTRPNSNSHPMSAYLGVLRWLGMFQIPLWLVVLIPLIIMGIIIIRLSPYNLGLFSTGFTVSSAEFLLLIIFQSIYGFVYQMAGLIIMIFMAGLVLGAGIIFRILPDTRKSFLNLQLGLGVSMFLLPLIMVLSTITGLSWEPGVLIGLLTFMLAVVTGIQYRLATKLIQGSPAKLASSTYGSDLTGSAFGMLLTAVFLFPLLGMMDTVFVLAGMNVLVAGVVRMKTN